MAYIVIEDFAAGVDVRKSKTTAPPGTLRRLVNGHITRGGEVEKRKAFNLLVDFADPQGRVEVYGAGQVSIPGAVELCGIAGDEARTMYLMGEVPPPSVFQVLPWDWEWVDVSHPELGDGNPVVQISGQDFWGDQLVQSVQYGNGENVLFVGAAALDDVDEWGYAVGGANRHPRSVTVLDNKVHGILGRAFYSSGVASPRVWNTDENEADEYVGGAVYDVSHFGPGAKSLIGTAVYQDLLAIFSRQQVQLWDVDPDPELYKIVQVIGNIGAVSSRGIIEFGNADVLFFSRAGIRGLRARSGVVYAGVTDMGSPIDDLVVNELSAHIKAYKADGTPLPISTAVNPEDNRLWMAIGSTIFVLSFFPGAKVSAWSVYEPGFNVDDLAVVDGQMYVRSESKIYSYGAPSYDPTSFLEYDDTVVEADLPFINGGTIATNKQWNSVDLAIENVWELYCRFNADSDYDGEIGERIGVFVNDTFSSMSHGMDHESTHAQFRLRCASDGYARFGTLVAHYDPLEAS